MNPLPARFDALVIGGGPAGLVTAAEVASRGFTVCVCDSRERQHQRIGEVLPAIARPLLEEIGVLDRLTAEPSASCRAMGSVSAWGSDEPIEAASIANPFGSGWYLDRARFDAMLAQNALDRGACLLGGARVEAVERSSETWCVTVRVAGGERAIESRVVVDATGRAAWLSRRLGGVRERVDRLIGICVRLAPAGSACLTGGDEPGDVRRPATAPANGPTPLRPDDPVLLVEAVEDGWWYSVPQPNRDMIVVRMTDADLGRPSMALWVRALGNAPLTSGRCDGLVPRSRTPMVHLAHSARTRLGVSRAFAVGDAAAAFDPLSSHGLSFAMRSGIEAARAIGHTLSRRGVPDGGDGPRQDYAAAVDRIFDSFLARRAQVYGAERRWAAAPFWVRRHGAAHA